MFERPAGGLLPCQQEPGLLPWKATFSAHYALFCLGCPPSLWPCSMVSINHTNDHSGLVVSPYPPRDVQRLNEVSPPPPRLHMLRLNPHVMMLLPWWLSGKESALQCRKCRRLRFNSWVRKIPWRRAWQPTLLFLPGDSYWQKSLVCYSP